MRLLACLLALGITACQHADSAERSAQITAQARPAPAKAAVAPAVAPAQAPATVPAPLATAPEEHHCGCGMTMSSCNGQCSGDMCGGGEAPHLVAPANATWTTLHVTGMHCGGCARRIERALAGVSGVLGVKADFASARVEVATASGVDARHLVQSTIDGLGYHVE